MLLLFLAIPFQKRFVRFFKGISRSLIPPDLTIPPGFSKHLAFYLTDLCIVGAAAFLLIKYRVSLRKFFWEGPSKFLLLFACIAWASVMVSSTSHYLLQHLVVVKLCVAVLFFNVLKIFVEKVPFEKWCPSFCWVILIAALGEATIAIAQYFLQHKVGLECLGETGIYGQGFPNPLALRWLPDALFPIHPERTTLYRSLGTLGHANPLGCFLALSLLTTSYLWIREHRKKQSLFLQCSALVLLFALATTFSRAAILFLACSLPLFFWLVKSTALRKLIRWGATLLIGGSVCLTLFYPPFFCRGGIVNYNETSRGADSERLSYQKIAVSMIKENPFLGVGFHNFQLDLSKYCSEKVASQLFSRVHNIYLLIASETGLLGLGAFLLFLWAILKRSVKKSWSLESKTLFCSLLLMLLCGTCDMYVIADLKIRMLFFALCGLFYGSFSTAQPVDLEDKSHFV